MLPWFVGLQPDHQALEVKKGGTWEDLSRVRALQQEGGAITFSRRVCEYACIHSKKRAHANLTDGRYISYSVREEHRVSLTMMRLRSQATV